MRDPSLSKRKALTRALPYAISGEQLIRQWVAIIFHNFLFSDRLHLLIYGTCYACSAPPAPNITKSLIVLMRDVASASNNLHQSETGRRRETHNRIASRGGCTSIAGGMERESEPRAQNLDIETRYNNHTLQGYAVPRSHPLTPSPGPSAIGPTIQWELAPTRIGIISSTAVGWDGRTEVGRNLSAVLLLENGVLCTIKVLVSSTALVHWLKQKQGSDLATTQRNEGNKRYSRTDMKMNEI